VLILIREKIVLLKERPVFWNHFTRHAMFTSRSKIFCAQPHLRWTPQQAGQASPSFFSLRLAGAKKRRRHRRMTVRKGKREELVGGKEQDRVPSEN
jgi:hypothetical protein